MKDLTSYQKIKLIHKNNEVSSKIAKVLELLEEIKDSNEGNFKNFIESYETFTSELGLYYDYNYFENKRFFSEIEREKRN